MSSILPLPMLAAQCAPALHALPFDRCTHHDPHSTHQQMPQGKRGVCRPLLSPPSWLLLLLCCFASSIAAARAAACLRRRGGISSNRGAFISGTAASITHSRTIRRMAKNGAQVTPPPASGFQKLEDGSICVDLGGRDVRPMPGKE